MPGIDKSRLEVLKSRAAGRGHEPGANDEYTSVFVPDAEAGETFIDALTEGVGGRFTLNAGAIEKSRLNADGNLVSPYAVKSAKGAKPSRTGQIYDTVDEVKVCLKNFTNEQIEIALAEAGVDGMIE